MINVYDLKIIIINLRFHFSLTAIINKDFSATALTALQWECVFSKDNGALFVNYICTSTFLGTASELMRLPELLVYCIKLCFARSAAEIAAIRQSVSFKKCLNIFMYFNCCLLH
jgi:hypothetical protein